MRATAVLLAAFLPLSFASESQGAHTERFRRAKRPVLGRYVVVFKQGAADADPEGVLGLSNRLVPQSIGAVDHRYEDALEGFAVTLPEAAAVRLSADPRVEYVQEDSVLSDDGFQQTSGYASGSDLPWYLDRIDQKTLPLDRSFNYSIPGYGVHIYVIDSGVRTTHYDFGGYVARADQVDCTTVFLACVPYASGDCNGHGTFIASLAAGRISGVAKTALVHSVRVQGCGDDALVSNVVKGIDWATQHRTAHGNWPAVGFLSKSTMDLSAAAPVETALRNSVSKGITWVVSSGNVIQGVPGGGAACQFSPARLGGARVVLTVGGIDSNDAVGAYSTQDACVSIFAPGGSDFAPNKPMAGASKDGDTLYVQKANGTSYAAPLVAGVAALYLARNPKAAPAEVMSAILSGATRGMLTNIVWNSPNLLVNAALPTSCGPSYSYCWADVNRYPPERCANFLTDALDCGSCDAYCADTGQVCRQGVCTVQGGGSGSGCGAGTQDCCGDGSICRTSCARVNCP